MIKVNWLGFQAGRTYSFSLFCSDDESMLSERSNIPSPISAASLAACMKVDSVFCTSFVPKLYVAATVNVVQLTVYNHMENVHNGKTGDAY